MILDVVLDYTIDVSLYELPIISKLLPKNNSEDLERETWERTELISIIISITLTGSLLGIY